MQGPFLNSTSEALHLLVALKHATEWMEESSGHGGPLKQCVSLKHRLHTVECGTEERQCIPPLGNL